MSAPEVTQKRTSRPSAKLTSADNIGEIELTSHQAARDSVITADASAALEPSSHTSKKKQKKSLPSTTTSESAPPSSSATAGPPTSNPTPAVRGTNGKRKAVVLDTEDEVPTPAPSLRPAAAAMDVLDLDESDADENHDDTPIAPKQKATRDVDAFFGLPARIAGNPKLVRLCTLCSKKGPQKHLVHDVSTCRRHLESFHQAAYNKWCATNNFESRLPKAMKARAEAKAAEALAQSSLDPHLRPRKQDDSEPEVRYTPENFEQALLDWLIATDQPLHVFENESFIKMMNLATKAPDGVNLPQRKATRNAIIRRFHEDVSKLRNKLTSDRTGLISLTCDAWQASNTDAYFAVTGHWTEMLPNGEWVERSALLGFVQMNSAHDGPTLGRALFDIIRRYGIGHKVGWITSDNAANNITMLQHFERLLNNSQMRKDCKTKWDHRFFHIRCMAHVINLATQSVLATYSHTKHFDPAAPHEHEPDVNAITRDEVGLLRAIGVKARSSAKRKNRLERLQKLVNKIPLMLLVDMKVRWSSTFAMLKRASTLKEFLKDFIYETSREEPDLQKRLKIDALILREHEWKRVKLLMELLEYADCAQQAFSYDTTPTLHTALPALEALHKAWTNRLSKEQYALFAPALQAGIDKIETYYDKTSTSHAYTMAMLLDPNQKMSHFKQHWSEELQKEVLESAEKIFKERHIEMYGNNAAPRPAARKGNQKLAKLMAQLESEDEDDLEGSSIPPASTLTPWALEFNQYLNGMDEVAGDQSLTSWWGVNASRFPVWASLARDHLSIMASSVSSERAFSSAGITISKRRNRLKGDIVEALQFLKCTIHSELLFQAPAPSLILEEMLEGTDDDEEEEKANSTAAKTKGWDDIVVIDSDDDDDMEEDLYMN